MSVLTKVQTIRDGMAVIASSNGAQTFSGEIYNLPIQTFTPLPNGFNLALANYVYDLISTRQALWDQQSWRLLVTVARKTTSPKSQALLKEANELLAIKQEMDHPTCGTTMCMAGWVTEAVKTDWVIDGAWLKYISDHCGDTVIKDENDVTLVDLKEWAETVVAPLPAGVSGSLGRAWHSLPKPLTDDLERRGFSRNTHMLIGVEEAALAALGLRLDDVDMFGSSNDLETLRLMIDFYTEHGPQPTPSAIAQFMEDSGKNEDQCMCHSCVQDRRAHYDEVDA